MKKLVILYLCVSLIIPSISLGAGKPTTPPLVMKELDGSPKISSVNQITVPNGTLTNSGGGKVAFTYISGASPTIITPTITSPTITGGSITGLTSLTTTKTDGSRSIKADFNSTYTPLTGENSLYWLTNGSDPTLKITQNGTAASVVTSPLAGPITFTGPTAALSIVVPDRAGRMQLIDNTFTHDYGAAAVTKAMTAAEASAQFISVSNASGAVELNIPAAVAGKIYLIYNNSGQVLTFKVTGQTGGTIANGKYAVYMSHASDVIEIMEQP